MGGLFSKPKDYTGEFLALNKNITNLMQKMMTSQNNYNKISQEISKNMEKDRENTNQLINKYQEMQTDMINTARKKEEDKIKKEEQIKELKKKIMEEVNEIERNKIIEIENEISSIKNNWCIKELYEITPNYETLITIFQSIIDHFKLENEYKELIKSIAMEEKNNEQVKKLNIQIIGKTGVGKSTLINSLLQLKNENEKAKEGLGECTTKETKAYENKNNYPGIIIYDTRGIEVDENFGIEEIKNNTLNNINTKLENNIPNELIHCLFYCIQKTRCERVEKQTIMTIRKAYDNKKLPIIIIHMRATTKKEYEELKKDISDYFKEYHNEIISDDPKNISFLPVLSKSEKFIDQNKKKEFDQYNLEDDDDDEEEEINNNIKLLKPYGLDKLIKVCFDKAKYCLKFACLRALKKSTEKIINKKINEVKENLNNADIKNNAIQNFNDDNEKLISISNFIFNNYFNTVKNDERKISLNNVNTIKIFFSELNEKILEKSKLKFNEYKTEKVKEIQDIILNEMMIKYKEIDIDSNFSKILSSHYLNGIIERDFEIKFKKVFQDMTIENAVSIFYEKFVEFSNKFIIDLVHKLIFKDNEIKNYFSSIMGNNQFDPNIINIVNKLINDLKEYQKK